MSCSTSRGINDSKNNTVQIMATRIFDNVRIDLDREPLILSAILPYDKNNVTPLYASGTGTFSGATTLSVSPRYGECNVDIIGNFDLKGNLTYIYSGSSYVSPCSICVPYSARMVLPEDALWPYEIMVHFSFFADNIKLIDENFNCVVDGTVICYITSQMPVSVLYSGPIEYNSLSSRQTQPQNTFMYSAFYPYQSPTE